MQRSELEPRVARIVKEHLGPDLPVTDATTFEELGADSLDVMEIVMSVEEEFDIEIPDDDYAGDKLATFGKLLDYLVGRL